MKFRTIKGEVEGIFFGAYTDAEGPAPWNDHEGGEVWRWLRERKAQFRLEQADPAGPAYLMYEHDEVWLRADCCSYLLATDEGIVAVPMMGFDQVAEKVEPATNQTQEAVADPPPAVSGPVGEARVEADDQFDPPVAITLGFCPECGWDSRESSHPLWCGNVADIRYLSYVPADSVSQGMVRDGENENNPPLELMEELYRRAGEAVALRRSGSALTTEEDEAFGRAVVARIVQRVWNAARESRDK